MMKQIRYPLVHFRGRFVVKHMRRLVGLVCPPGCSYEGRRCAKCEKWMASSIQTWSPSPMVPYDPQIKPGYRVHRPDQGRRFAGNRGPSSSLAGLSVAYRAIPVADDDEMMNSVYFPFSRLLRYVACDQRDTSC